MQWMATPPARRALASVLAGEGAAILFSWTVVRNAPATSAHGGPLCQGGALVPLALQSRLEIIDVLQVSRLPVNTVGIIRQITIVIRSIL